MTKGGAREASSDFPVGRGMGFEKLYDILTFIKELKAADYEAVQIEANKKYAWWDDPKTGGRTETCRAFMKELWRLGLIDRIFIGRSLSKWVNSETTHTIVPLTKKNWGVGAPRHTKYAISELGSYVLDQKKDLFPYYVAWCIINTCKNGHYPQVINLLKLFEIVGYIPVNEPEVVRLTKEHNIYVDHHGSKAIKFGYLEPTGIIYRVSNSEFHVNLEFIKKLYSVSYKDLFLDIADTSVSIDDVNITLVNNDLGLTSFDLDSTYKFDLIVTNKSTKGKKISISHKLFSLFYNVSEITSQEEIYIEPNGKEIITVELISKIEKLADSLIASCIGYTEFICNSNKKKLFLPYIDIVVADHIWELELIELFKQLSIKAFHLTGKSDRPDGIIDLSNLRESPENLLEYLRDEEKEKLLMETTLGEYGKTKLIADTIKENKRGMTKFQIHNLKVLKIAGVGQIIASETFSSNILETYNLVKSKVNHIITLIDKSTLLYLIEMNNKNEDVSKIIEILKCNDLVTRKMIDEIYN